MTEKMTVKVHETVNPHEIDEYLSEHSLTPADVVFEGRHGKYFRFSFTDKQKMMMFKLRFSG